MKLNILCDIAFQVEGDYKNLDSVPVEELLQALKERVSYLSLHPQEIREAVGFVDSYETTTT
jgi:hypothetical protein